MASTKLKLLKNYKFIIEITAKALRLKCSGKRVCCHGLHLSNY